MSILETLWRLDQVSELTHTAQQALFKNVNLRLSNSFENLKYLTV